MSSEVREKGLFARSFGENAFLFGKLTKETENLVAKKDKKWYTDIMKKSPESEALL